VVHPLTNIRDTIRITGAARIENRVHVRESKYPRFYHTEFVVLIFLLPLFVKAFYLHRKVGNRRPFG